MLAQRFGLSTHAPPLSRRRRGSSALRSDWTCSTFSVGQHSFVVDAMSVAPGSELDGLHMYELSTRVRVIAITRRKEAVQLHPRRNAQLRAADTTYVVGTYRELLSSCVVRARVSRVGPVREWTARRAPFRTSPPHVRW